MKISIFILLLVSYFTPIVSQDLIDINKSVENFNSLKNSANKKKLEGVCLSYYINKFEPDNKGNVIPKLDEPDEHCMGDPEYEVYTYYYDGEDRLFLIEYFIDTGLSVFFKKNSYYIRENELLCCLITEFSKPWEGSDEPKEYSLSETMCCFSNEKITKLEKKQIKCDAKYYDSKKIREDLDKLDFEKIKSNEIKEENLIRKYQNLKSVEYKSKYNNENYSRQDIIP